MRLRSGICALQRRGHRQPSVRLQCYRHRPACDVEGCRAGPVIACMAEGDGGDRNGPATMAALTLQAHEGLNRLRDSRAAGCARATTRRNGLPSLWRMVIQGVNDKCAPASRRAEPAGTPRRDACRRGHGRAADGQEHAGAGADTGSAPVPFPGRPRRGRSGASRSRCAPGRKPAGNAGRGPTSGSPRACSRPRGGRCCDAEGRRFRPPPRRSFATETSPGSGVSSVGSAYARLGQKRNVYWSFVASRESCLLNCLLKAEPRSRSCTQP